MLLLLLLPTWLILAGHHCAQQCTWAAGAYLALLATMGKKMDPWPARPLRREQSIKASMITHTTNNTVFNRAKESFLPGQIFSEHLTCVGCVLKTQQGATECTVCFMGSGSLAAFSGKNKIGRPKHHWAPNAFNALVEHRHVTNNAHIAQLPSSALLQRFGKLYGCTYARIWVTDCFKECRQQLSACGMCEMCLLSPSIDLVSRVGRKGVH